MTASYTFRILNLQSCVQIPAKTYVDTLRFVTNINHLYWKCFSEIKLVFSIKLALLDRPCRLINLDEIVLFHQLIITFLLL